MSIESTSSFSYQPEDYDQSDDASPTDSNAQSDPSDEVPAKMEPGMSPRPDMTGPSGPPVPQAPPPPQVPPPPPSNANSYLWIDPNLSLDLAKSVVKLDQWGVSAMEHGFTQEQVDSIVGQGYKAFINHILSGDTIYSAELKAINEVNQDPRNCGMNRELVSKLVDVAVWGNAPTNVNMAGRGIQILDNYRPNTSAASYLHNTYGVDTGSNHDMNIVHDMVNNATHDWTQAADNVLLGDGVAFKEPTAVPDSGDLHGGLDIHQTPFSSDCWFLTSIAALEANNPNAIHNMITYETTSNGTIVGVKVVFPGDPSHPIALTAQEMKDGPLGTEGRTILGGWSLGGTPENRILEAAAWKYYGGNSNPNNPMDKGGKPNDGLPLLTGRPIAIVKGAQALQPFTQADFEKGLDSFVSGQTNMVFSMGSNIPFGDLLIAAGKLIGGDPTFLAPDHGYWVSNVDKVNKTITLVNPLDSSRSFNMSYADAYKLGANFFYN